jgi:chromosome segregation ATPase
MAKLQYEADNIEAEYRAAHRVCSDREADVNSLKSKREKLLAEYHTLEAEEFNNDCICPTCRRPLPEEEVQNTRERWNERKANELDRIATEGKKVAADIGAKSAELTSAQNTVKTISAELETARQNLSDAKAELDNIKPTVPAFDTQRIEAKKAEIAAAGESVAPLDNELTEKISGFELAKAEHEKNIAAIETSRRAQKDIDDLKAREKELARQFEECEKIISLCDSFTSDKVKMLDDRISGAFKSVRFKLTETQINGGMKEICDTMIPVEGALVPYRSANNAARVQANCDIVATFQRHYGIEMPVFVDNRESVVRLPDMPCQVISLVVSEADKHLRIEVA